MEGTMFGYGTNGASSFTNTKGDIIMRVKQLDELTNTKGARAYAKGMGWIKMQNNAYEWTPEGLKYWGLK